MDDLFSASTRERSFKNAPLAVRMRPNSLDEYVGQQKAVGKGSWLRAAIEHDVLSSVILYGPAGTGKTTLAHIIANHTKSEFVESEMTKLYAQRKDLDIELDDLNTTEIQTKAQWNPSPKARRMPRARPPRAAPARRKGLQPKRDHDDRSPQAHGRRTRHRSGPYRR